jgi:hypothetical protein
MADKMRVYIGGRMGAPSVGTDRAHFTARLNRDVRELGKKWHESLHFH